MKYPNYRDLEDVSVAECAAQWLQASIVLGGLVGFVVGLWHASSDLGFAPGLAWASLIETSIFWLGAGLIAALTALTADRLLARWLDQPRRSGVAAAVAITPWLLVAGYQLNRWLGVRPSQLLTSQALPANGGLVLLAVAGWIWLTRRGRRESTSFRVGWLAALLLVVLAVWASRAWIYRGGQEKVRPDVVVILVDALRADRLGAYGYSRETTPAIDRLAEDGIRFEETIAASTFTKSSIASLFTGRYPYQHGVYWGVATDPSGVVRADVLAESETTIAERLRDRGYLTEAWVQNGHLKESFGFGQGFVHYRDSQGHSPRIVRLFRRFLDEAGQRYPYFAYLHLIDLHDPYDPPEGYRQLFGDPGDPYSGIDLDRWGAHLEAIRNREFALEAERLEGYSLLYDSQLRAVDDQIAHLVEELVRQGRYDNTLIIVTSDHGDAFGEHGVISHSTAPYDELVRVPWIVKLPKQRFAGRVVGDQVSLVDFVPTLLDALGLGEGDAHNGCSRWPEIRGASQPSDDCSIAVTEIAERDGEEATLGLRTRSAKYLRFHEGREEFYDLLQDPREQHNLASDGEEHPELSQLRHRGYEILAARHTGAAQLELDEATLRELRALGYVK